jgi:alpha-L-fucosidase
MKLLLFLLALTTSIDSADQAADAQAKTLGQASQRPVSANKHPDAQWFPDAGLGLFIHWGIGTVGDNGDISWGMLANKPWTDITVKPSIYFARAKDWKPDRMDYAKMLAQASAAGFTYAVMVTKHHDGLALWPSKFGDFGTRQFLDGRDFVKEYVAACRKHGLKVGLYYSPPDWWFDRQ